MGLFGDLINAFEVPRKSKASAYGFLIFFGLFGRHEFYLENYLRGILYIISFVAFSIGWFKPIPILAYISAGILTAFFVFDFFTLWKQVDKWNYVNAGNSLIDTAGEIAGNVISIPLNNAIEEYNGVVKNFKKSKISKRKNRKLRIYWKTYRKPVRLPIRLFLR
jgi:TM2 domain-containing membrane protein YozV